MNIWVSFGLKFTLFYKGKIAKISPKIRSLKPEENQKTRLVGLRLIVSALYTFEPRLLLPCICLLYLHLHYKTWLSPQGS